MRSYLFVFNADQTTRRNIRSRLDSIEEVVNWMNFFENAFCIVSDLEPADLSKLIREAIPDVQFMVVLLEKGKRNGWLPRSVWDFLNHPTRVGSESAA